MGRVIGGQAQSGDIFLLTGPLGAGKTCLTQGIGAGLDVPGHVRSPTFVLMSRHQGRLTLNHLDLYRIEDPLEAWELGIDEQLFGDGICVVEWADRAVGLFPDGSIWIHLDFGQADSHRTITFSGGTCRYEPLLRKLAESFPEAEEVNV